MHTWQKLKAQPQLLGRYLIREQVTDAIRHFFKQQNFHEVQTPILVPVPSCEPNLEVFTTQLSTFSGVTRPAYLIMSPEYSIKKLLAGGVGNCFEITRAFRNSEEVSRLHHPEFTMLEWYRINSDYTQVMSDFERLFHHILNTVNPGTNLSAWTYQGQIYDLSLPWPRLSVAAAFNQFCGISEDVLLSPAGLHSVAKSRGWTATSTTPWETLFYQFFFNEIEPALKSLGRPAIIYDYPASEAALARRKASDPRFAERFEVFLAGIELGNCFSELTDATEQAARFTAELATRASNHKTTYPMDTELISALESGLPPVSGIAVGVDRLVMLAADVETVADTLFFPASELFDLAS